MFLRIKNKKQFFDYKKCFLILLFYFEEQKTILKSSMLPTTKYVILTVVWEKVYYKL